MLMQMLTKTEENRQSGSVIQGSGKEPWAGGQQTQPLQARTGIRLEGRLHVASFRGSSLLCFCTLRAKVVLGTRETLKKLC